MKNPTMPLPDAAATDLRLDALAIVYAHIALNQRLHHIFKRRENFCIILSFFCAAIAFISSSGSLSAVKSQAVISAFVFIIVINTFSLLFNWKEKARTAEMLRDEWINFNAKLQHNGLNRFSDQEIRKWHEDISKSRIPAEQLTDLLTPAESKARRVLGRPAPIGIKPPVRRKWNFFDRAASFFSLD